MSSGLFLFLVNSPRSLHIHWRSSHDFRPDGTPHGTSPPACSSCSPPVPWTFCRAQVQCSRLFSGPLFSTVVVVLGFHCCPAIDLALQGPPNIRINHLQARILSNFKENILNHLQARILHTLNKKNCMHGRIFWDEVKSAYF